MSEVFFIFLSFIIAIIIVQGVKLHESYLLKRRQLERLQHKQELLDRLKVENIYLDLSNDELIYVNYLNTYATVEEYFKREVKELVKDYK